MNLSNSYIFFLIHLIQSIAANYENSWANKYPNCGGLQQSPINLDKIERDDNHSVSVRFKDYDVVPDSMKVENKGRTVQVTPTWYTTIPAVVKDGVLYEVQQMHFHWVYNNDEGSEHIFEDRKTVLELHIVHWNPALGDFDGQQGEGILVVGLLYEIGIDDEDYSNFLFNILNYAYNIEEPKSGPVYIKPFGLESLFYYNNSTKFLTYIGSLTTPPCSEGVSWVVLNIPSTVNEYQMDLFQNFELHDGDDHNNRPVQKINGRKLTEVPRTDI
ncbi:GSCOCG00000999001-RA-CDS [Cotesia congregata]|uniref:Similar to CA6: Carbonic anhydrase 6 (Canis lupus familiaris) n=1 Tax=Cotesia congregata TaxID=51543 RepID=A0A8J2MJQ5_COTCN|nr:GSCOCG00000999001-RA-CDS [Cotesia congregata]CAG5095928.1 Similar to CA6: Carbonic anhydrase 6 (Canis lupus familiaris) [Cotesia congregata]